jgi:hypothetical protein
MCTNRSKEERDRCTSRIRRRWPDMHLQAKNKRDGYTPAG